MLRERAKLLFALLYIDSNNYESFPNCTITTYLTFLFENSLENNGMIKVLMNTCYKTYRVRWLLKIFQNLIINLYLEFYVFQVLTVKC